MSKVIIFIPRFFRISPDGKCCVAGSSVLAVFLAGLVLFGSIPSALAFQSSEVSEKGSVDVVNEGAVGCPCSESGSEVSHEGDANRSGEGLDSSEAAVKKSSGSTDANRAKVLVIGDSLGLCGFGKALDSRLRKASEIAAVYSYMACGTVPISWLKSGPLSNARTACGIWNILGKAGERPLEVQDTYGMQKGKRPDSHPVPKLETLLEEHHPDILVIQNGTNLLSLFSDGKTLIPSKHEAQLNGYLQPMMRFLAGQKSSLKKVYWVCPPVSGRVTAEIQDFLFKKIERYSGGFLTAVDSRTLITAPYRGSMPDKEHFVGKDMDLWAEGIFKMISNDLSEGLLGAAPLSREKIQAATVKQEDSKQSQSFEGRVKVVVRAKLVSKSQPLSVSKLVPYQESMVSHLYEVVQVVQGEYPDSEVLVMHPAHIKLVPQNLWKYQKGRTYTLDLVEFEGSPWESIKRSDETGRLEMNPFIRKEDELRFPSLSR